MAGYDYSNWRPMRPQTARELFAGLGASWWIAGGWAIDLWLGRQTREHEDLDIGILHRDHLAVQQHLVERGWDLHCGADKPHTLRPWLPGEELGPDNHCPWARRDADSPWEFQLLINPGDGCTLISRRDPSLTLPMSEAVIERQGFRVLAPQVQLHFKAKQMRPRDEADFANVLPRLDSAARAWLHTALQRTHPGHAWIPALSRTR
jgi:hypothetical protein